MNRKFGSVSRRDARRIAASLDEIASSVERDYNLLGMPRAAALDFATRCDMVADHLEQISGLRSAEVVSDSEHFEGNHFDAADEIGDLEEGPLEMDDDDDAIEDHFTQKDLSQTGILNDAGALNATTSSGAEVDSDFDADIAKVAYYERRLAAARAELNQRRHASQVRGHRRRSR